VAIWAWVGGTCSIATSQEVVPCVCVCGSYGLSEAGIFLAKMYWARVALVQPNCLEALAVEKNDFIHSEYTVMILSVTKL